jgi:hypothetical protein
MRDALIRGMLNTCKLMFNELIWKVIVRVFFLDTGGIVDHQFKFLFIVTKINLETGDSRIV